MREEIHTQRILIADEGRFLTNGKTSGEVVTMPLDADASVWREITEEEKIAIDESQNVNTYTKAEQLQTEIGGDSDVH